MHVVPLRLEPAVAVEHLDAMVLAIGHVHPAVGVAADVVRNVELAGIGAGLAPRAEQRAVRRVLVHARVTVAVGHVQISLRRQRGVRAAMEGLAAHVRRRLAGDAEGQQHLAVERAVPDGVVAVVGQPQGLVGRHVDAVGAMKDTFAPGAQEVAVAIQHDHRVLAPIECVDAILLVDPDRGDVGVELLPRRQLRPAVDDLVPIGARAQDDRHFVFLLDSPLRRRQMMSHRSIIAPDA